MFCKTRPSKNGVVNDAVDNNDDDNNNYSWIAQSAECRTKKPRVILTRVHLPGARVNFQCRLSTVFVPYV